MPDTKQFAVAQKLEQLKQRFREKASVELDQLKVIVEKISGGACEAKDVSQVYQLLHRLAGSAGTFGYTALGEEARQLEQALKPLFEKLPEHSDEAEIVRSMQKLLTTGFLSRIGNLNFLLEHTAQQRGSVVDPLPQRLDPDSVHKLIVQIIDSNSLRANEMASGLELHGFETMVCGSSDEAKQHPVPGLSAVVIRATQVLNDNLELNSLGGQVPVVCIGSMDLFTKRYHLAELGASGFLYDPIDVPILADYITSNA